MGEKGEAGRSEGKEREREIKGEEEGSRREDGGKREGKEKVEGRKGENERKRRV